MLEEKIDGVEKRLSARIHQVEERLDKKIDGVEKRLSARIDRVEERLDRVEHRLNNLEVKGSNSLIRKGWEMITWTGVPDGVRGLRMPLCPPRNAAALWKLQYTSQCEYFPSPCSRKC